MKTCTKCGETKPYSEYHLKKSSHDGFNSFCKMCNKAASKSWYEKNTDKAKASRALYQKQNADKCKASQDKWRSNNLEKHKETKAAWRLANIEKEREFHKAYKENHKDKVAKYKAIYVEKNADKVKNSKASWRRNNPDAVKILSQNRRAKLRSSNGKLSKGIETKLFKLQRGKCICCGLPLEDGYHIDHITPLALGGSNTDDNVQLLRAKCNMQKSAKHPVDFMQERGYLL